MASLFEQFATNKKAEIDGVDVTFGSPNEDGSVPTFRIARMGPTNKRYKRMLDIETKPHSHAIRNETLDPDVDAEITMKLFTTTVLIGWKNLVVEEVFGSTDPVEYSPVNASMLMKALPDLYAALREQAAKMSNFREIEIKADTKN